MGFNPSLPRRNLLRGAVNGVKVAVALPVLDIMLDGNGQALAATGAPLPKRFGTWFWGCGMNEVLWTPKTTGSNYELSPDLAPFASLKHKVNVLSGFNVELEGRTNDPHFSGLWGFRTGLPATSTEETPPSFDVTIADQVGGNTRFRSLEVACNGTPLSYSRRSVSAINPAEFSVAGLYARIFGPEFQDPNAATFRPSTQLMARRSVLSGISEDRKQLLAQLGSADRARMEEYFTSLRQIENQVELQLQKPAPLASCAIPTRPRDVATGTDIEQVEVTHKAMAQLLAMAMACNQTRVFNVFLSDSGSTLRKGGTSSTFHGLTHEEITDPKLGYQPQSAWFQAKMMQLFAEFITVLDGVKEGAGTLLDNCLVVAHSDCSLARTHEVQRLPVLTAGALGGRIRNGQHLAGNGQPVTRIGLTAMQAMGLAVDSWGSSSMQTSRPLTEILV